MANNFCETFFRQQSFCNPKIVNLGRHPLLHTKMQALHRRECMNMQAVAATADFRSILDYGSSATEKCISSKLPSINTISQPIEQAQSQSKLFGVESDKPSGGGHTEISGINIADGDFTDVISNATWPMVTPDLHEISGSNSDLASSNISMDVSKELITDKVQSCPMWVPLKPIAQKPVAFTSSKDSELMYQYYRDSWTVLSHPQQLAEEATRKREMRLIKNRVAAKRCRQRKREYVNCLEERLTFLRQQNEQLVQEVKLLRASVLLRMKESREK